eukprot:365098-Chlamydomonas_euryale.AAC.1
MRRLARARKSAWHTSVPHAHKQTHYHLSRLPSARLPPLQAGKGKKGKKGKKEDGPAKVGIFIAAAAAAAAATAAAAAAVAAAAAAAAAAEAAADHGMSINHPTSPCSCLPCCSSGEGQQGRQKKGHQDASAGGVGGAAGRPRRAHQQAEALQPGGHPSRGGCADAARAQGAGSHCCCQQQQKACQRQTVMQLETHGLWLGGGRGQGRDMGGRGGGWTVFCMHDAWRSGARPLRRCQL